MRGHTSLPVVKLLYSVSYFSKYGSKIPYHGAAVWLQTEFADSKQMSNPKNTWKIFLFGSLNSANQGMEYFEGPAADVLGEGNVPIDSREVLALC